MTGYSYQDVLESWCEEYDGDHYVEALDEIRWVINFWINELQDCVDWIDAEIGSEDEDDY